MARLDRFYFGIGLLWLVVGMALGIGMGAAHEFRFAAVHAHINLIGFACHALFGVAHRLWPRLAASGLAAAQFWIFVFATPVTLAGLVLLVLGGPELPVILGSFGVIAGAALFALMFWRSAD